ncbi:hypothetical protein N4Q52_00505 [Enterobacter mori]|uniref:hypothetical protein n=1 Tax=Enterobacter mori TaxID=539813 RepID=UPI0021B0BA16|nr:hypothetical protein [Enterobacter mori]MCT6662482.1 hypothetical protein [Enterobacter mori]
MITELSAALAAIKETASLARVINEAKTDSEIKAATLEIQSKLIALQMDCFSLGDALRLRDAEIMHLKAKNAEFEDFRSQTEGYALEQLDSGTFVYSKNELVSGREISVKLCPLCYSKNVKSILHSIPVAKSSHFHKSRCLLCENKYLMNNNPAFERPKSYGEIGSELNGDRWLDR